MTRAVPLAAGAHPAPPQTDREKAFLKSRAHSVRGIVLISSVLAISNGILLVAQYWLLATALSDVVLHQARLAEISQRLAVILGLILLRVALTWAAEIAAVDAGARVKQVVRQEFTAHLAALGPVRLAGEAPGAVASALVEGIEAIEPYYTRFLPAMILVTWLPLAVLAAVLVEDRMAALIMVVTAPLIPLFMILIGKGAERMNQRQWAQLARMGGRFLDAVQNLVVLKWFNASRAEINLVARASEEYRQATMAVLRVAFLSSLALEFFATIGVALVAVAVGFRLLWGEIDFARGLFVLLVVPEFYLPLRNLGAQYHARMEAVGAIGAVVELLGRPLAPQSLGAAAMPTLKAPPEVVFAGVSLTYPDGRTGLNAASFQLAAGRITALVGPSGAGKSSVASLLLGFVPPTQGEILINGAQLRDWDLSAWRQHIAWLPQRPHLFRGSIADNIRLGANDADDAAVRRAARAVGADDFIAALPHGYGQEVGERGAQLSGGQMRLVALARAALRDATLLILDEPTANLDNASEAAVIAAIQRLAEGRTVLLIAHRPEAVRLADLIVTLADGRTGTPA